MRQNQAIRIRTVPPIQKPAHWRVLYRVIMKLRVFTHAMQIPTVIAIFSTIPGYLICIKEKRSVGRSLRTFDIQICQPNRRKL